MKLKHQKKLDLSVVMPCLNEQNAVAACIKDAKRFIAANGLNAEIIVVDNGSTDNSAKRAKACGAVVIYEPVKGYGRALRTGIENSRGEVIIFGDCDTTYDFLRLEKFYYPLKNGSADVIIGNRISGGIEKGAMPFSHKAGVAFLSFCGRIRFHTDIKDFHCGIRSLTRDAAQKLSLHTNGMEFATEFIAQSVKAGLRIAQTPATLRKASCKRRSKLNAITDGLRHLGYIITYRDV